MKNFFLKKSTSIKLFDLGIHPFADTFISANDFNISEPVYPLRCFLDKKSGCIFNEIITSDKKRYNLYDYSYTSSNSQYSKNYWKKYADNFKKKYELKSKILEIGCNDGYLLNLLSKKGFKSFGCDASKFICNLQKNKKKNIMNYIFNLKNSKKIKKTTGKVNFVIANNVVNHSNNPNNFIKGVKHILDDDGYFIFEQPYWLKMIKSSRIDQIYHEHITYFTVKFAKWILEKNEMYIYDFKITPYHGGSLRIISKKKLHKEKNHNKVIRAIQIEEKYGLFKKKIYKILNKKLNRKKIILHKKIKKYKKDGYKIVGVGAAAKANTFLCYFNLDNKIIDFVTDASDLKIGKFTPKTRIPIYSDKILKKYLKVVVILLSWNISNILKTKLKKLNKNLKFINL